MTFWLWCHYKKMPVCDLQTVVSLKEKLSLWHSVPGVIIRRAQSVTFSPWCHYKKMPVCDLQTLGHYKEMPVCDIQTVVSL